MGYKTSLKIGEFSRLMQVTVKTLRHYEQKERLIPNEVDEWTGYRYYSIGQMQKLNSIRHMQQLGFTLEEIRDLYDEESHTPSVEHLTEKIKETERATIVLHYFEDRSIKEIASILEIPLGTVKYHLSIGRNHLKDLLQ